MIERIAELQGRLSRSRAALEALADRAAALRSRIGGNGAAGTTREAPDESMSEEITAAEPTRRSETPLAMSLERIQVQPTPKPGKDLGEDGGFVSDSWEIALIEDT